VKAEVKEEEAIVPMDPALLADLPPMSTGILLPQTGDVDGNVVHPPFELDENTMRTLQQFMDSHGFHTSPNHSADEQVYWCSYFSDVYSLPLYQEQSLKPIRPPHWRRN
jgi:hypothetical protein